MPCTPQRPKYEEMRGVLLAGASSDVDSRAERATKRAKQQQQPAKPGEAACLAARPSLLLLCLVVSGRGG
jgi:hypothetical protein